MATFCSKPVSREVLSGGQLYIVTMTAQGVLIREKGKRTTFGPVPWSLVYLKGAQMAVPEKGSARRRPTSRGLLTTGR